MTMSIRPPATFLDANGYPAVDFKVYLSQPNTDPLDESKRLDITDSATGETVSNPFLITTDGYPKNTGGNIVSPVIQQQEYAIRFEMVGGGEQYQYDHIKGDAFGLTGSEQPMVNLVFNNFPQANAADLTGSYLIFIQSQEPGWEGTAEGPEYSYYAYYTGGNGSPGAGTFDHFFDSAGNEWKITESSNLPLLNQIAISKKSGVAEYFATVSDMQSGDNIGEDSEPLTISSTAYTNDFAAFGDGGGGKFVATGVVDLGLANTIDIIGGDIYTNEGVQMKLQPINGRVKSASMGLIPDGVTDYFASGQMDKWLQYLSVTDVTGVFIAGGVSDYYNCGIDQFYSNVSIYGEPGAVFAGTIHIAINTDINNPTLDRPRNVVWMGEAASYVRVGSWNCDDIYIQRIAIYEDAARAQGGFRAGGVHFFGGSKSMYVGDCFIENSERSAALAVDYEPGQTSPENIHFDNIYIESSYVHGVSFVGENITFDKLVVEEYGMGNLADPNINYALSQNPGGLNKAMGFSLGSFGSCAGGSLVVNQNPAAPTGDGSGVNLFTDGSFQCGKLDVDGSLAIGFQNNSTDCAIDKLTVNDSATQGLFNKAMLAGSSLKVTNSGTQGIRNEQGGLIAYPSVITSDSNEEGYDSGDGRLAVGYMLAENNNKTVVGYGVVIGTTSKGNVDVIEVKQAASGVGGGVSFTGTLQGLTVGNIISTNATNIAAPQVAGVLCDASTGLTIGSAIITGDNGVNSFQPLRLTNNTDLNLNGFRVTNSFNTQIVSGTIALVDRVGFMNCTNDAGTNISVATVSEFNCTGMSI